MNKKIKLTFIVIIFLGLSSCNTAESKINRVENAVKNVQKNENSLNQNDWNNSDTLISNLEVELEKNRQNFSPEQIEKANKAIGQYKALRIKHELTNFKKSVNDIEQQIKGAMEVLTDTSNTN
jgi:hypothetical protein